MGSIPDLGTHKRETGLGKRFLYGGGHLGLPKVMDGVGPLGPQGRALHLTEEATGPAQAAMGLLILLGWCSFCIKF